MYALHPNRDPKRPQPNHRQETVPEHGCCPVGVDPAFAHEVEQGVDGDGAEEGDRVDVGELTLSRLQGDQITLGGSGRGPCQG